MSTQGKVIYTSPIGPTQPSGWDVFGTVKDAVTGAFNFGLDYWSDKMAFDRQLELLKYQKEVSDSSNMRNTLSGYRQPEDGAGYNYAGFAGMSTMTLAILGVALVLILKK